MVCLWDIMLFSRERIILETWGGLGCDLVRVCLAQVKSQVQSPVQEKKRYMTSHLYDDCFKTQGVSSIGVGVVAQW